METNRINIEIPLKKHLAHYILKNIASSNGVLLVDAKSSIGSFFYGMVEKGSPKKKHAFENTVTISFPERDRHGKSFDGRFEGLHINDVNVARVNEFLDYIFRKELYSRLDLLHERGEVQRKSGKIKDEIVNFMQKYNIQEEDLTYEALKKSYYRYRKSGKLLIEQVI